MDLNGENWIPIEIYWRWCMKRKLMHSSWTNDRKPLQCGSCAIPAVPYCGWFPAMNLLWMPPHLYLRARDPKHCRQFPLKPNILCFQNSLLWFITSFFVLQIFKMDQNGTLNPWTNYTNYITTWNIYNSLHPTASHDISCSQRPNSMAMSTNSSMPPQTSVEVSGCNVRTTT